MTAILPSTKFALNGASVEVTVDPQTPLLYVLRNDLEQTGTRYGCGLEQCGACTVLIDGEPAYACTLPLGAVTKRQVTTVEGLDAPGQFPELVAAFETLQAAQCGYCVSGILIRAAALLKKNPTPDEKRSGGQSRTRSESLSVRYPAAHDRCRHGGGGGASWLALSQPWC